jgi:hypothetical protein
MVYGEWREKGMIGDNAMMRWGVICSILLIIGACLVPASAFTADSLDVWVANDQGDASVRFEYTLTWYERVVVFFRMVQPEQEFEKALEGYSGKPVDMISVTDSSTQFLVYGLATVEELDDRYLYTTPELNFSESKQIVNRYWFHRFLKVDLSPAVTTVRFPDGYAETFYDEQKIPRVAHEILK